MSRDCIANDAISVIIKPIRAWVPKGSGLVGSQGLLESNESKRRICRSGRSSVMD